MILKIVNGKLDLLNDHGGKLRTIAEKNVVDAALSNDEKQILIPIVMEKQIFVMIMEVVNLQLLKVM